MGIPPPLSRISRTAADGATPSRRRKGSEPAANRRDALIAAAERVFCKRGYHDSTMDDVAAAAGISKRTLYQLVQSKEELFTALLARHRKPFDFSVDVTGRPIEAVLHDMLAGWARHVLSPPLVALLRLIMAEYIHGKTLSRLLDRESAKPCRDALRDYFTACVTHGQLAIENADEAALMLYGMAIGNIHIELLLGLGKAPSRAALDARITRAVALFLTGARPRPSAQIGEPVREG
ncbi:TetR/AcrR family transcriptional regulator [Acidiphilium sp.]|uniref:TetR/AcrR family transcriptional regulator n=1 Tax=Acidiphilium sp. TaxID=527 RepID=UPI003D050216